MVVAPTEGILDPSKHSMVAFKEQICPRCLMSTFDDTLRGMETKVNGGKANKLIIKLGL